MMQRIRITSVLSLMSVLVLLSRANGEQLIPLLEMKLAPSTMHVSQPCPTTMKAKVLFRNNSLSTAINVDWTSAYVAHNANCVADYAPKNGAVLNIPAQGVKEVTITVSFIGACDGTTTINFQGTVQGAPADTDSKVLTVQCNSDDPAGGCCLRTLGNFACVDGISETECTTELSGFNAIYHGDGTRCGPGGLCIPATSEWGLAVLAIIVLIAGTVALRRRTVSTA